MIKLVSSIVRRTRNGKATYKAWRREALVLLRSEAGDESWLLKPVIKEVNTLPYIMLQWLKG